MCPDRSPVFLSHFHTLCCLPTFLHQHFSVVPGEAIQRQGPGARVKSDWPVLEEDENQWEKGGEPGAGEWMLGRVASQGAGVSRACSAQNPGIPPAYLVHSL